MDFREYVKGDRVIRATETAYRAIYQAQGFSLRESEAGKDGKTGSGKAGERKSSPAHRRTKAE
ncbi:MAG: hypothetical protein II093_08230 [Selenomonas sp.]|nr:hypothetical protein [Selenomonas sp.]